MSEIRHNALTGRDVLVSPGRLNRLGSRADIGTTGAGVSALQTTCPLCVGREAETPPEVARYPVGAPRWRVRVVPNKYPAVAEGVLRRRAYEAGMFVRGDAVGLHDVIVECPQHVRPISETPAGDLELLMVAFQERQRRAMRRRGIALFLPFKNNRPNAGASLEHPHSQCMALGRIPVETKERLRKASDYFDRHGRNLLADVVSAELLAGTRTVVNSRDLVAFVPFAASCPCEVWICPQPRRIPMAFSKGRDFSQLSEVLLDCLRRLDAALTDAFNLILHIPPFEVESADFTGWWMQIIPRVTVPAGFELGAGLSINPMSPEEAAEKLRKAPAA